MALNMAITMLYAHHGRLRPGQAFIRADHALRQHLGALSCQSNIPMLFPRISMAAMLRRNRPLAARPQPLNSGLSPPLAGRGQTAPCPGIHQKPIRAAPGLAPAAQDDGVAVGQKGAFAVSLPGRWGCIAARLSSTSAPRFHSWCGASDGAGAQQVAALQVAAAHGVLRQHFATVQYWWRKLVREISAGAAPGGGMAPSPQPHRELHVPPRHGRGYLGRPDRAGLRFGGGPLDRGTRKGASAFHGHHPGVRHWCRSSCPETASGAISQNWWSRADQSLSSPMPKICLSARASGNGLAQRIARPT